MKKIIRETTNMVSEQTGRRYSDCSDNMDDNTKTEERKAQTLSCLVEEHVDVYSCDVVTEWKSSVCLKTAVQRAAEPITGGGQSSGVCMEPE